MSLVQGNRLTQPVNRFLVEGPATERDECPILFSRSRSNVNQWKEAASRIGRLSETVAEPMSGLLDDESKSFEGCFTLGAPHH